VADYFIEVMSRRIEAYWAALWRRRAHAECRHLRPEGDDRKRVLGLGGDALPWLFKQAKLGPLVGKRTWADWWHWADSGADGRGNGDFAERGVLLAEGQWDVENHGVDPDYVVEQDPKAVSEGHDPQLEKAVALALEDLKEHPRRSRSGQHIRTITSKRRVDAC